MRTLFTRALGTALHPAPGTATRAHLPAATPQGPVGRFPR